MDISSVVAMVVLGIAMAAVPFVDEMPRLYRKRACQGLAWRRAFPDQSKSQIRTFLAVIANAFDLKQKGILRLRPDDEISAIYRGLYPSANWPDALEREALAEYLKSDYGLHFQAHWHEHLTLGELFSRANAAQPGARADGPRSARPAAERRRWTT